MSKNSYKCHTQDSSFASAGIIESFRLVSISPVIITESTETIIKADKAPKKDTKEQSIRFSGKKRSREMMDCLYTI
jgi:hypothetical protein